MLLSSDRVPHITIGHNRAEAGATQINNVTNNFGVCTFLVSSTITLAQADLSCAAMIADPSFENKLHE